MDNTEKLWRECCQCDTDFYIKAEDQKFFESRGLELPKRCWSCRQKNKREAMAAKAIQAEKERQLRMNGNRKPKRTPVANSASGTTTTKYKRREK